MHDNLHFRTSTTDQVKPQHRINTSKRTKNPHTNKNPLAKVNNGISRTLPSNLPRVQSLPRPTPPLVYLPSDLSHGWRRRSTCVRARLTQNKNRPPVTLLLLNLADNLARPAQALDHLLALLAPADRVVRLLQQVVHVLLPVQLLEQLGLHRVFGESSKEMLV